MSIPTPHNAAEKNDIAKTVLMPGDPLRAKFIAENYLENAHCYNNVRGMLGFTGTYKGKRISVQGHGMGIPSISIYSYELFNFYDVDNIIRIGSAGALTEDVVLMDMVFAMGACTDSNYMKHYKLSGSFAPISTYSLLNTGVNIAKERSHNFHVGNVLSSDIFYGSFNDTLAWSKMGVLAVEMEAAGLYMNAAQANKNALCILTISDELYSGRCLSQVERQTGFINMIETALELSNNI